MILVERDYAIMRDVERFRFILSRQIRLLAGFEGQRACDRRTKLLIEAGYIDRKKVLYGVPSVYYLTHKGKMLIGASKRPDKIQVEKIPHDIAVADTAIYFILKNGILPDEIQTEKEINSKTGFTERKHRPDFIIEKDGAKNCVEVELSVKAKARFEKIVESNYLEYKTQYWIAAKSGLKIRNNLENLTTRYPNIEIILLEEVQEYVRDNNKGNQSE